MVTYESETDLDRCINSLEGAAPRSDLTISAWDNASTDGSVKKLQKAKIDVVQSSENIGFASAVNRLTESVDTEFIFLLNPDAAPFPGAIDVLVDAALEKQDRDVFCGRTVFPDGRENHTSVWAAITPLSALMFALGLAKMFPFSAVMNPEAMPDWGRNSDRAVDVATGCAVLIRTATWRALDGFDPRYWMYGEEADLQFRMVESGRKRPWFVSGAKFIHDKADEIPEALHSDSQFLRIFSVLRARATLMRTNWRGLRRLLVTPILSLLALRYGVQSLLNGPNARLRTRLWRTRQDWMAGYPKTD